jgi:hypothetical protein
MAANLTRSRPSAGSDELPFRDQIFASAGIRGVRPSMSDRAMEGLAGRAIMVMSRFGQRTVDKRKNVASAEPDVLQDVIVQFDKVANSLAA